MEIKELLSNLNDEQLAAVQSEAKQLRVIAGAGSGKTRVLTTRIAHLIENCDVRPYQILAITFTNKATAEMRSRLFNLLKDTANNIWIFTIHALCVRILREDIEALNYPRNFTIVDSEDQKQIVKEAYKEFDIDRTEISINESINYIGSYKAEEIEPDKALQMAYGDSRNEKKAKVYKYYQERLHSLYALDFDDLILMTLSLFRKYEELVFKWSSRFYMVLVDEFQDIDWHQYELIKFLCQQHQNLYVVGDPDQTIYTWRGADVNIIMNFHNDFPDAETIILNQNYRSSANILNGANSLIVNNKYRVKKDLFSTNGAGQKITHKTSFNEEGEALFVVSNIIELVRKGNKYHDCCVLYRSNYLSRSLEKVFMDYHIPYVIYGGIRFYERAEVKDILAYLRLIVQEDDLSLIRVINNPKRGIGPTTVDNIRDFARGRQLSMYECLKKQLVPLSSKNLNVISKFITMIENWQQKLKEEDDLEALLEAVLEDSGYRAMLEEKKETERLENIKSLIDDIASYQDNYEENALQEYLQMISLYTDKTDDKTSDSVNLMTVHAAKGLEFDNVFIYGFSEGIFPSKRSIEESDTGIEEERRLAYVAFTRAKKRLYISDNTGFSYVTQGSKNVSRFLSEVDSQYINDLSADTEKENNNENIFRSVKSQTVLDSSAAKLKNKKKLRAGDNVIHELYGKGVIIAIEDDVAKIAFEHPYGVHKILKNHPSLKRDNGNT